jgi:hypothetical protein
LFVQWPACGYLKGVEGDNAAGEDWDLLVSFFPAKWKQLARSSDALKGLREDKSAEAYLRVLVMHLGCGFSLRETVARAREAEWAQISDVALLNDCVRASSGYTNFAAHCLPSEKSSPREPATKCCG